MCSITQIHPVFKIVVAIVVTVLYFKWMTNLHEKHDILIKGRLDDTLSILRSFETKTLSSYESLKDIVLASQSQPTQTERNKKKFAVADRGFWQGLDATSRHVFDEPLATALIEFLKAENVTNLLELGCGTGAYAKQMKAAGILVACYDGNPETQDLSEGRCGVIDLSKPLDFGQFEWTLSLEVGEHIPKEFEDIFLSNVSGAKNGLIVSWAVEGQGGTSHVNNRNNSYIRDKIVQKGFNSDFEMEKVLRAAATRGWFKNTIMVFRKQL